MAINPIRDYPFGAIGARGPGGADGPLGIDEVFDYRNLREQAMVSKLTVDDVVKLAGAGVKIDFAQIRDQVTPNPPEPPREQYPYHARTLPEAFWDRWRRSHVEAGFDPQPGYNISCHMAGETVFVFVQPKNAAPFTLEDNALIYPSDALMAQLALWEKTHRG